MRPARRKMFRKLVVVVLVAFLASDVSTVEIAKIRRRKSISPFTLYDQALEKLAELRQIVNTAILLAHSDISSSTTAHNDYTDGVKDKGESELNDAAQTIDGHITDIKNLADDVNIDVCLQDDVPALDQLLASQISELKSCITDINNRVNNDMSEVLLNVDSTINKVDDLQNQLELCTSGSIICISPVVRDIDVAKTELPETINVEVHDANENIDVLTTEVDGCSTSSVATYNTESGTLLERIETCVNGILV
jgi:gas vesicle protein